MLHRPWHFVTAIEKKRGEFSRTPHIPSLGASLKLLGKISFLIYFMTKTSTTLVTLLCLAASLALPESHLQQLQLLLAVSLKEQNIHQDFSFHKIDFKAFFVHLSDEIFKDYGTLRVMFHVVVSILAGHLENKQEKQFYSCNSDMLCVTLKTGQLCCYFLST